MINTFEFSLHDLTNLNLTSFFCTFVYPTAIFFYITAKY